LYNNPYQLLVFDWDGTLMDSAQEIIDCFQGAAKDQGQTVPAAKQVKEIIGIGMQEAIRILFPGLDSDQAYDQLIASYRDHYFAAERKKSELFEGIFEMISALESDGFLLGVATSKGRRGLDLALERSGLDKVFHFTRCIDEAPSKPHPQMLLDIIDYTGVDADRTLMIGDTEFDLLMAKNAGTHGLGVCCGAHPEERLWASDPITCLQHTIELRDWLKDNKS